MTTNLQRCCARFLHQARRLYWRIFRPLTLGVAAIVLDPEGRIVLIKNSYRDGWHLPGGGVQRGENVADAVRRELREEVGFSTIDERPEILGIYSNFSDRNFDHVVVFIFRSGSFTEQQGANLEIESMRVFPLSDLPSDIGPGSARRIKEFLGAGVKSFEW